MSQKSKAPSHNTLIYTISTNITCEVAHYEEVTCKEIKRHQMGTNWQPKDHQVAPIRCAALFSLSLSVSPFLSPVQHWKIAVSHERWPGYVVCFPFNLAISHSHLSDQCLDARSCVCAWSYVHGFTCYCVLLPTHVCFFRADTNFSQPVNSPKPSKGSLKFVSSHASLFLSVTHTHYLYTIV